MYVIVAGGGKVGANLARSLISHGHEVTMIEQRPDRFETLEEEFEHQVQRGDATEVFVLEQAGIARPPDIVIAPTVCATLSLLALVEHEVPEHELVHLLELRKENLEIVEVQIDEGSPCVGKSVEKIVLPAGSQLISVVRNGQAKIADGDTTLEPGDQVLAILEPGKTDELKRVLLKQRP